MKKDNVNYLLVGSFTLIMFLLLMIALYRMTGQNAEGDLYYSTYSDITGIGVGTIVSYGGYRIGQVDGIEAKRDKGKTYFELTLALQEGWKVPQDSAARIVTPGMLSDKQINIEEGDSDTYLKPGDFIKGREEASIMSIMDSVAKEINDVSRDSIKPFLDILTRHVDKIGGSLGETIPDLMVSTQDVMKGLDDSIKRFRNILSDKNTDNINQTVENITRFSGRLEHFSREFSGLSQRIDRLLMESNDMIAENRPDVRGSVKDMRKVMSALSDSINSITYNLEAASHNMNEFSRQVRENPGLLLDSTPQQAR